MTDLLERLQGSLGGSYRVERELGGGGMSRVFTAIERALDRPVVVKVLPPDLAIEISLERFQREIQVAARLQHPNIVPLLTAGEADGVLYYTMPLVEGESLRARLARYPLASLQPLDRPYFQLAYFFAVAGRSDRARALIAERAAVVPAELRSRVHAFESHLPRAALAITERRAAEAIAEARLADDGPCLTCILPLRGRAYELGGHADSALVMYEGYVAMPFLARALAPFITTAELGDAGHLAPTLRRLGELNEERGDRAKAAHYYGRFVEPWKGADPELQPQVADVRRRLERLAGERAP